MFDNVRKYAVAYLVAFGGVLLTCLSSWNVRQELQSNHLKEFEWAADDRIQAVRVAVDQGLDAPVGVSPRTETIATQLDGRRGLAGRRAEE